MSNTSDTSRNSAPQQHTEDDWQEERALADEIPSTARHGSKNKAATVLGFISLSVFTLFLIWWVNFRQPPPVAPPERDTRSHLPPIPMGIPPPPVAASEELIVEDPYGEALKRRMSGSVNASTGGSSVGNARSTRANAAAGAQQGEMDRLAYLQQLAGGMPANESSAIASRGRLAAQLEPTVTQAVKAGVLPNRNFVLAKGSTLDCVLETAIDSTVPGITTCQLTRDIYSDNGKVLLLDKGSQLVGEYSGGLQQGQARMFMLWTRARTPNGVVVNLDSPAIDELGRAGVDGHVDSFFWRRFGAAILMSVISDGINASSKSGNNNYLVNTGKAGEKVVESMLQQHANIAPRLVRNQGTRVSVMVARDLDFSEVYALKHSRP